MGSDTNAATLNGAPSTLVSLATAKGLPVELFRQQEWSDIRGGGIAIPYFSQDGGTRLFTRERGSCRCNEDRRFHQPAGTKLQPYGLWRLADAPDLPLFITEGETDCLTLWHHGYRAIGLAGSQMAGSLAKEHLDQVTKVCLVPDNDPAGLEFIESMKKRFETIGYKGEVTVLRLPDHVKDVNDLHRCGPAAFKADFDRLASMAVLMRRAGEAKGKRLREEEEFTPDIENPWPGAISPLAYHGLAGEIVAAITPYSEADPAALLVQILVAFGSYIGRTAYWSAEADRHYANNFVVLVGKTAKGRKGTSWGHIDFLLRLVDESWHEKHITTGLSSGEGLIWEVRDRIMKREKVKKNKGTLPAYEDVEIDAGVVDKRLLIVEPEFANVLKMTERQNNTLSAVLRNAWDGRTLRSMVKNSPARSTNPHISLIGHITAEELKRCLSSTEAANGYGNRHLWICCKRSKLLPDGGSPDYGQLRRLADRLAVAARFAQGSTAIFRDADASSMWHRIYGPLSDGRPGLSGALLGRAEAHVMRLAMLYALLDCAMAINLQHLQAALALWEHCEKSVRYIWGEALGDSTADDLLRILRTNSKGVTRWEMSNHFGRHVDAKNLTRALQLLLEHGLARKESKKTGGRPEERWFYVQNLSSLSSLSSQEHISSGVSGDCRCEGGEYR